MRVNTVYCSFKENPAYNFQVKVKIGSSAEWTSGGTVELRLGELNKSPTARDVFQTSLELGKEP